METQQQNQEDHQNQELQEEEKEEGEAKLKLLSASNALTKQLMILKCYLTKEANKQF